MRDSKKLSGMLFSPKKDFMDEDGKDLFGISVNQQGPRLLIFIKIYQENRREEIIDKTKIMARVAEEMLASQDIQRVCIIDSKDVVEQLSKRQMLESELIEVEKGDKKFGITIEVLDLVRRDFVPVEYSMAAMRIDKNSMPDKMIKKMMDKEKNLERIDFEKK